MDYKERLSEIHAILKETFSDDITYTKEKDYLYLECKGVKSPNHNNLTLKLKIKYDDLMLNEMQWAYSAGQVADDHYVLRSDRLDSIRQSLIDVVDNEMFSAGYLNSLPTNEKTEEEKIQEARNTVYLQVVNEIQNLGLSRWKVEFMNSNNDYILIPSEKGILKETFNLTIDVLNEYDPIKMLELKQVLGDGHAYHEVLRIKDVLKRLL